LQVLLKSAILTPTSTRTEKEFGRSSCVAGYGFPPYLDLTPIKIDRFRLIDNRGLGHSLHIQPSLNRVDPLGHFFRFRESRELQYFQSQLDEVAIYFLVLGFVSFLRRASTFSSSSNSSCYLTEDSSLSQE
jgi:hypothetical protein